MVIPTVRDGDCGPDTMCTLLAMPRLLRERTRIRHELAGFLLKHSSNRALIGSMFGLAEVPKHLGLFELEAASALLFVDNGPSHGDGATPGDASHGDGAGGVLAVRSFSPLEITVLRWKCGLRKASDEHILAVMRGLPQWCIEQGVIDYEARSVGKTPIKKPKFLTRRDMRLAD